MGAEELRLPVEEVVRHSAAVDEIAAAVRSARAAVGTGGMQPDAYGMLCGFLPPLLSGVFEIAAVAMNGSAEALQETAINLRAAVALVERTDTDAARDLRSP